MAKTKSALHIDDAVRHFVRTQYPNMEFVFAYDDAESTGYAAHGKQGMGMDALGLSTALNQHIYQSVKGGYE